MSIYMYMDMCMDMCIDMRAGIDPWQAVAVASFDNPRGRYRDLQQLAWLVCV